MKIKLNGLFPIVFIYLEFLLFIMWLCYFTDTFFPVGLLFFLPKVSFVVESEDKGKGDGDG